MIVDDLFAETGFLWVSIDMDQRRSYLCGITINEDRRGQCIGIQTLALFDTELRDRGVRSPRLNVFGDNHAAQALYRKCGYWVTNVHMQKVFDA